MVRRIIGFTSFALTAGAALAQSAGSAATGPGTTPSQAYSYGIGASGWIAIALWLVMAAFVVRALARSDRWHYR